MSLLVAAWLSLAAGAHLTALLRWRRLSRASGGAARADRPRGSERPHAALVRPLAGAEHDLAARLRCAAGCAPVVFCVGAGDDGAMPAARAAVTALTARGEDGRLVVTGARGPNHKADQLARALAGVDAELVVLADSDVVLPDLDLGPALARFDRADVGAVWLAPVVLDGASSWGDRATSALLSGSLHALPMLGCLDREGLVGKLLVVRTSALAAAGGFDALRGHLGEDMELGRRLRDAGYRVELDLTRAFCAPRRATFGAAVERYARWIAVIRQQRPGLIWSYPLLFAGTTPALVAALAMPRAWVGFALGLVLARAAVFLQMRRLARQGAGLVAFARDVVLADVLLWCAFVRAIATRTISWRGRELSFEARRV